MDFGAYILNGKWLVTNPSTSPENFPKSPGNQEYFDEEVTAGFREALLFVGSTIDMQILNDLFNGYVQACNL